MRPVDQDDGMLIAVIGGPIASGKSSLGRATAARLQTVCGAEVGVIDLDLIYEMLDPRARSGRPKSDERSAGTGLPRCAGECHAVG